MHSNRNCQYLGFPMEKFIHSMEMCAKTQHSNKTIIHKIHAFQWKYQPRFRHWYFRPRFRHFHGIPAKIQASQWNRKKLILDQLKA
jgi:hypothetical protein